MVSQNETSLSTRYGQTLKIGPHTTQSTQRFNDLIMLRELIPGFMFGINQFSIFMNVKHTTTPFNELGSEANLFTYIFCKTCSLRQVVSLAAIFNCYFHYQTPLIGTESRGKIAVVVLRVGRTSAHQIKDFLRPLLEVNGLQNILQLVARCTGRKTDQVCQ